MGWVDWCGPMDGVMDEGGQKKKKKKKTARLWNGRVYVTYVYKMFTVFNF